MTAALKEEEKSENTIFVPLLSRNICRVYNHLSGLYLFLCFTTLYNIGNGLFYTIYWITICITYIKLYDLLFVVIKYLPEEQLKILNEFNFDKMIIFCKNRRFHLVLRFILTIV